MTGDRPFLGILLMLGFCLIVPLGDSLAKLIGPVSTLATLIVARFVFQLVILTPMALAMKQKIFLSGRLFWLAYARTLLQIAGLGCMFTALLYLPLADAVAIAFVMPFIMLLLGWFFLNETVGTRRIIACSVGFVGTLMVIQPNFLDVGWPVLYPLAVAVIFAFYMLVTRQIAKDTEAIALQAQNGITGCLTLIPILAVSHWLEFRPFTFEWPSSDLYFAFIIMGVGGTVAHLLMTLSLRFAPSATLAPMQYLEIPVATLYGYLMFNELPNGLAAAGIVVTIAAGLYIIYREQASARSTQAAPQ
ncbi:DMT family transporter [Cognatishimia activa]|uniref:DMT family transporter n=1 Tax=Cognatishimia activa TaxID=1715691 RepID=A0A975EQ20_9RHOB|nr:DMT family transporter [Cognatishimia activa]QTN36049.1 DMT family transporter [Cognatishimia activa]